MSNTHLQRVIMLTAYSGSETVKAILDMKVSNYVVKPFRAADLIRKLSQVLGRNIFA